MLRPEPLVGKSASGPALDDAQIHRYSRHIVLPEMGGKGQQQLLRSRVLIVGLGGLGAPVALYLAAAGVGTLGLVDWDKVELSNLQRQIIHRTSDIGLPKVASAAEAIRRLNPDITVETYAERLTADNALAILERYDLIVDGTDSFPARYLLNDACVLLAKTWVHGAVVRFDGQLAVFAPGQGCYRCLFPEPPAPGQVSSCAEGGVLSALPGVVGTMQAVETLKILLGVGHGLVGRLLLYDGLAARFSTIQFARDPRCPACGDNPSLTGLIDYEQSCSLAAQTERSHP
ncbi:MAG: HesA/MoeB/ThiF family protein [Chloroflexota bacterium]